MILGCKSLIVIHLLALANSSSVRFTNLKCTQLDPSFTTIETCILKVLQRGVIGLNIHVKLHKVPVTNVSVNLSLYKKGNGYGPCLYNASADLCKFMKLRKQNPILKLFFDAITKDSNINHTCPFDHDIIVHNWILKEKDFQWFPLPEADYMCKVRVGAYNDWKVDVHGFFSVTK